MRWEAVAIMLIGVIVMMIMAAQARMMTNQDLTITTDTYTEKEELNNAYQSNY